MMKSVLALVAVVAVNCGCASSSSSNDSSDAWKRVRLTTDREMVRGCQFLINVRDDSAFGIHSVEEEMLKQTAKAGGNVLLETRIQEISAGLGTKSTGGGEAYLCKNP